MKLSDRLLDQAKKLRPGDTGRRIVLDPRGIHHKIIPSRDFRHSVSNHADEKNCSAAESLFVVEKLKSIGAVDRLTRVEPHGAIFQAFHGAGGRQACHTLPCQLVLGNRFPHLLLDGQGHSLNSVGLHRIIQLFARCTWQPAIVNSIDQALDWTPGNDFVSLYLNSVKSVLDGTKPVDAFREFTWQKESTLRSLLEQVQDEPLNEYDAMLLSGALTPGTEPTMTRQELERLLADKATLTGLQQQREVVVETYAERDRIIPHSVGSGDLLREIQNESWISAIRK